jgi:hypothetical protein
MIEVFRTNVQKKSQANKNLQKNIGTISSLHNKF